MKAMLLAAGLGTRLQPLTNNKPKALVEIKNVTLLEWALRKLYRHGFTDVIINIHHFGEQIIKFVEEREFKGMNICFSDERDELLDTGGGLKKAEWFLKGDEPFLLYNADILTTLDLSALYQSHLKSNALATLAIKERPGTRFFMFNDKLELCGWHNTQTKEIKLSRDCSDYYTLLAFSGIHIISPEIFKHLKETGKFSITNAYLHLAKNHTIKGVMHNESYWLDAGKQESINKTKIYFPNSISSYNPF